jgi:hypothetical protein
MVDKAKQGKTPLSPCRAAPLAPRTSPLAGGAVKSAPCKNVAVQYGERQSWPVLNSHDGRRYEPASPHGGNGVASSESRQPDVPKSRFPVAAIMPSAGVNFMTADSFFGRTAF